jgi:hypothetical protein
VGLNIFFSGRRLNCFLGSGSGQSMQTLKLNTRLSTNSWLEDDDSDDEDPFAEVMTRLFY